jgi:hypothetical protein
MAKKGYGAERMSGGGKVGFQENKGSCYGDGSKVGGQGGGGGFGSGAKGGGQGQGGSGKGQTKR